ncbi:hypothetical protein C4J81_15515 [Deltaproteobacteria bacterium Smac51]|nr:hypothetical protein C4J81_15515 [Deltaproteobacteria bacterium Smac51]
MSKLDLLMKLKALAEKGIGGEKENAENSLHRLMEKYGFTEADLGDEDKPTVHYFKYKTETEMRLLMQVVRKVTNAPGDFYNEIITSSNGRDRKTPNKIGAMLTPAQIVEVDFLFSFYSRLYNKELNSFFLAFCGKHKLSHRRRDDEPGAEIPTEELAKILAQMRSMDDATPYRQIETN